MSRTPDESIWDQPWREEDQPDDSEEQSSPTADPVIAAFLRTGPLDELEGAVLPEDAIRMQRMSPEELQAAGITPEQLSGIERLMALGGPAAEVAGKYKIALLFGVALASLAVGVALDPTGSIEELKPVLGVLGVAEAVWIGGAAVCLASVGKRLSLNPLKIKELFEGISDQAIAEAATNNPVFRVAFVANLLAALAEGGLPTAVILAHSGVGGVLKTAPFLVDLGITLWVRGGMVQAIREHQTDGTTPE